MRFGLIGLGGRGTSMFAEPLVDGQHVGAQLVALCDTNPLRLTQANAALATSLPTFVDHRLMIETVAPDAVIVCTPDVTHAGLIIDALRGGCDVISEKPLATTAEQCRAILDAERMTGRNVQVSHNARYGAPTEAIYRLLREGVIGEVVRADFCEFLNTSHGADYFRRWHRRKANSGGLLVHKASHHFDQLNWWLSAVMPDEPVAVLARGRLAYYGPRGATRLDLEDHGERCLDCPRSSDCPFLLDLEANERLKALYLNAESVDGYYRDRCVFDESIDIEDTLSAVITYASGVEVSYTLDAFTLFEGQRIGFVGTQGRLEVDLVGDYHRPNEMGILEVHPSDEPVSIRVYPLLGEPYSVPVSIGTGGHGGADARIRAHLFDPLADDPLGQRAGARDGARAVMVGVAANRSLVTGQRTYLRDVFLPD